MCFQFMDGRLFINESVVVNTSFRDVSGIDVFQVKTIIRQRKNDVRLKLRKEKCVNFNYDGR